MKRKIAVLTSGWSVDFVIEFIKGMQIACQENKVDLYIFSCYKFYELNGDNNLTGFAIFDLINYKDFDGVVIMPNLFNDQNMVKREYERIKKSGVPAVAVSEPLDGFHYICSYNQETLKELIEHLITKHQIKDFAFIGGPLNNLGAESNYTAFVETMKKYNIQVNPDNLYLDGDWTETFAYKKASEIFSKKTLPQAIVCINDFAALAVNRAALEHGIRIPEDLKVIGFDNIKISQKIIPSLSTVDLQVQEMGKEAVNVLVEKPLKPTVKNVCAKTIYGQSCGCANKITTEQMLYSLSYSTKIDDSQRFTSQLRHMEDVFIQEESVQDLCKGLQHYFELRHTYEGKDFAVLIKDEVVKTIDSEKKENSESVTYGKKMDIMVNIQNGVPVAGGSISTSQLIPNNMISDKPSMYLFMPIFNQQYLHGYYVAKDNSILLENKNGYNWTRNFGANIEKFRQTYIYREISKKMEILSTKDSLSDLLNRAGLERFANPLFVSNNKNNISTEILFVDINDMKIINDQYGHLHGDLAVKTVADTINKVIPSTYLAVRYGGDEFVIVGPKKNKKDFCKIITDTLAENVKKMSLPYEITVSLGEKVFNPNEQNDLMEAIKVVDEIMYKNKTEYHKNKKTLK